MCPYPTCHSKDPFRSSPILVQDVEAAASGSQTARGSSYKPAEQPYAAASDFGLQHYGSTPQQQPHQQHAASLSPPGSVSHQHSAGLSHQHGGALNHQPAAMGHQHPSAMSHQANAMNHQHSAGLSQQGTGPSQNYAGMDASSAAPAASASKQVCDPSAIFSIIHTVQLNQLGDQHTGSAFGCACQWSASFFSSFLYISALNGVQLDRLGVQHTAIAHSSGMVQSRTLTILYDERFTFSFPLFMRLATASRWSALHGQNSIKQPLNSTLTVRMALVRWYHFAGPEEKP